MKILFIPQNEAHILNMKPVAKVLATNSFDITFLDTRKWYFQKIDLLISETLEKVPEEFILNKSFFMFSSFQRLKIVWKLEKYLKSLVEKYDSFVFGTESALHRVIIHEAKRNKKKTFLIQDGILTDPIYSLYDILKKSREINSDLKIFFKQYVNKNILPLIRIGKLSYMLPGLDGASGVDCIFTMGAYNKMILERRTKKKTQVIASGIPRYNYSQNIIFNPDEKIFHICYITAAYKWHGSHLYNIYQHKDLELLCSLVKKKGNKNIRLNIKIHPREEVEDYSEYLKYGFVKILNKEDMLYCFKTQNLLLTQISTALIEAIHSKRIMYSMFIHYPYWKRKGTFSEESYIKKIFLEKELQVIIENILNNPRKGFEMIEDSSSDFFISKQTNNSPQVIGDYITKQINSK